MQKALIAATLIFAATSAAWAHGPSRLKVTETITIAAPPEAVWNKIKDFNAMQGWHPAVASSEAEGGNNVGAMRTLHLKGGGKVVEELTRYSDEERRFSYKMKDPGPVPVNNYSSTLGVTAGDGGSSVVEWRGAFYRGYPNNDPPPEQNDDAAIEAVTGVYRSGLENLKKIVEQH